MTDLQPRRSTSKGHLLYRRHFVLLGGFSLLAAVMAQPPFAGHALLSFASYGALHALALVLALRARPTPGRLLLFIAVAAVLSMLTLQIGLTALQWSGRFPGNVGLHAALGFSAMTGALAYGMALRQFRLYVLPPKALVLISIGCAAAAYLAFFSLTRIHGLGRWWLAVLWWYAFSGGLWYFDRRQSAAGTPS